MRILIISRVAWDENNSFGNTYSTFFRGMENIHIANVYCAYGKPYTKVAERFFCINEKTILQSIFNGKKSSGKEVYVNAENYSINKIKYYETARKKRWQILFWVRDLIWKTGKWKSKELLEFIDTFKPDIIFSPFYYSIYMNDVRNYIFKYLNVPMVSFVSDDIYTMKQFRMSPLFWIDRLIIRKKVKDSAKLNNFLYVITNLQKEEYSKILHPDCRLLYKGADFNLDPTVKRIGHPILIVYTGNLSAGRWRTLSQIGKVISQLNRGDKLIKLHIYSNTPLTVTMKKALDIQNAIELKGSVPSDQIASVQTQADILLHCESFKLKERLQVRLSFSTKIVDYFSRSRCILAIGSDKVASISYLIENDAAIVVTQEQHMFKKLQHILHNPEIIDEYAKKAWLCGQRNHQISNIQERLYEDLMECIWRKQLENEDIMDM